MMNKMTRSTKAGLCVCQIDASHHPFSSQNVLQNPLLGEGETEFDKYVV